MKVLFSIIVLVALTGTILMNNFGKTAKKILRDNPNL